MSSENIFNWYDNICSNSVITECIEPIAEKLDSPSLKSKSFLVENGYSIVLQRIQLKEYLSDLFRFASNYNEIDFLIENALLIEYLPIFHGYFKKNIHNKFLLELELFSEAPNWKTLFINVFSNMEWEESDKLSEDFIDILADLGTELIDKINISIEPYAL
ncbi:hypothetical protein GM418_10785 [Maribellus comscasis]|uniref:Uncharacterized protein n=1 Tax=Maribellus comscasis TaxID=2681766 RepID=A0A6I6JMK5_9BACT|nr:hypothetical protein [Maribellus comscasis]QGY44125.1 hypothetical protein GM418_10785 [Maribellus comscasis]